MHDWSLSQISFIITFFCSKFIQNLHWIIRRFILTWSFNFCLKANEKEVTNILSVPGSWICNLLIYEWDKRNNSVLLYYHHTILNHSKHKDIIKQRTITNMYRAISIDMQEITVMECAEETRQTNKWPTLNAAFLWAWNRIYCLLWVKWMEERYHVWSSIPQQPWILTLRNDGLVQLWL